MRFVILLMSILFANVSFTQAQSNYQVGYELYTGECFDDSQVVREAYEAFDSAAESQVSASQAAIRNQQRVDNLYQPVQLDHLNEDLHVRLSPHELNSRLRAEVPHVEDLEFVEFTLLKGQPPTPQILVKLKSQENSIKIDDPELLARVRPGVELFFGIFRRAQPGRDAEPSSSDFSHFSNDTGIFLYECGQGRCIGDRYIPLADADKSESIPPENNFELSFFSNDTADKGVDGINFATSFLGRRQIESRANQKSFDRSARQVCLNFRTHCDASSLGQETFRLDRPWFTQLQTDFQKLTGESLKTIKAIMSSDKIKPESVQP